MSAVVHTPDLSAAQEQLASLKDVGTVHEKDVEWMAEAKEKIREIRSTRQSAGSPLERLVAGVRLEY